MWDLKYRPLRFEDVLGQDGSIQILKSRLRTGTAGDTSYIFSGGHGQGKCVIGNTLVTTCRGLVPIESLMGPNKIDPLTIRVQQECGVASTAYSYRGGLRETIRIRTYLGFELEGTPNHRIRVLAPSGTVEWKHLGDITEGDYACIVRKGLFGTGADLSAFVCGRSSYDRSGINFDVPSELTPAWGFLMGCMIGDGACHLRSSVSISCAEPDVRKAVLKTLRELGGEGYEILDKRQPGLVTLRCPKTQFRAFLAFLGVGYAGVAHKTVPWSVLASPKPVVAAFLRAYFECDGSVRGQVLEAVTKSRELARQLQVLLLQFGIVTRRFTKRHRKYGVFWRVRVTDTSVDLFRREIGFISEQKQNALGNLVNKVHAREQRKLSDVCDTVPYQTEHLRRFYAALPAEGRNRDTSHFFRARRGKVACTTRQVERIATEFRDMPGAEHFVRLHDAGYIFDPVVHVTHGENQVFDLNVPQGEMFAANGFMNHNTTLARILARAMLCQDLNKDDPEPCNQCEACLSVLDDTSLAFRELDAASNGTIDKIRAIVDRLGYVVQGADKHIILFDEMHRMSKDSQDVLLKPVEDKRFVALFCTTEADKIRGTIRSRCEEHVIRRVPRETILTRMRTILETEGVAYEDDAILTVIDFCDSHIRDTINRLCTIALMGAVTLEAVRENLHLGMVPVYYEILLALTEPAKAVELVDRACDTVVPDEVAAGLAEAAMNAYRVANGMFASYTAVDRKLAAEAHARYGTALVALAEHFSKAKYNTKISLLCDVLSALSFETPAPTRIVVEQVAEAPVTTGASSPSVAPKAPQSPVESKAAPAPGLARGPDVRVDGIGPVGQDPFALTKSDHKAVPTTFPRGHRTTRQTVMGDLRVFADKLLTADEWRREFLRIWPGGGV